MRALGTVAARAREGDMLQLLALFLATLFFVLAVLWPSGTGANEAWFALAPVRAALLSLLATGFGAAEAGMPVARRRATAGALLLFVCVSAPFELAAYAASYPATPLWWPSAMPFVDVLGYLTLGVALGRLARWMRVDAFLTLLVPAVLVALAWLDVRLGLDMFDPLTTAVHVAWPHAGAMIVLALAGALLHLPPRSATLKAEEAGSG